MRRCATVLIALLLVCSGVAQAQNCPTPVIVQTGGSNPSCAGQPVNLDAGPGVTYLWSNGATSRTIIDAPISTTSYTVTVTDANGCSATSPAKTIVVNPPEVPAINAPATLCGGSRVSAEVPPMSGFSSFTWTISGGTMEPDGVDGGPHTNRVFFTPDGSGPVTLSVSANDQHGCETSSSVTIPVHGSSSLTVHLDSPTTCPGSSNIAWIDGPAVGNWQTVQWSIQNGSIYTYPSGGPSTTASILTSLLGEPATVTVTATDTYGCSSTASATIGVRSIPSPVLHLDSPTTCPGSSNIAWIEPPAEGSWQTIQWSVQNATVYTYAYGGPPTTASILTSLLGEPATVTVTATDTYGCSSTASATIGVRSIPPPVLHLDSPTTCPGSSNIAWIDPPAEGSWQTIQWSVQNGTVYTYSYGGPPTTASVLTSLLGEPATVTVTATDTHGCSSTASATIGVRSIPPPVLHLDQPSTCPGASNIAWIEPPAGGSWQSIQWSIQHGTIYTYSYGGPPTTASIITSLLGEPATVTVTATDTYGCSSTASATIGVHSITPPVLHTDQPNSCTGSYNMVWIDPPADGTGTWRTIDWSVQHGTINPSSYPYGAPAMSGSFISDGSGQPIVITANVVDNYGCQTSASVTVPVLPSPDVVIDGPQYICPNRDFTVTATNLPGVTYAWYLTNGYLDSASGNSATIHAGSSDSVYVTVGATGPNGCTTYTAHTWIIGPPPPPTVTASGPTTFCAGGSVTLTASAGTNYYWSNGATTRSIAVTAPGTYSVTVVDANSCGSTSAPIAVNVLPLPAATITPSGPTTFCAGGSVTLTASAGTSYSWSTGATTQSITVSASGSYSVTVTDNGCSATSAPTAVTVTPLPDATVTADGPTTFCAGGSVTLTAPAADSYSWSNGATTRSINVTDPGSYRVTVTTNGCSTTSTPTAVSVTQPPAATISGPTSFCQGSSATLTASAGSTYLWSTGATTPSITVNAAGTYSVTITNAGGCSATASTTVTSNPPPMPTLTASGPTTFCQGGSVTLTASAGTSYQWSNGMTTQSINVTSSGTYKAYVTDANGCGAFTNSITVTVNSLPARPTITPGSSAFCPGGSVTFTSSPAAGYLWSNGATTQSITVSTPGTYTVTVTNANGCSSQPSFPVTTSYTPEPPSNVTASGPTTFCAPGSVTLTGPDSFGQMDRPYTYHWSTGATTQAITVSQSGTYTLTVTNFYGCSKTSSPIVVTANDPPKPTITADGPTTLCTASGQTTTLRASDGASSYYWYTGERTQSITVARGGTYRVIATYPDGCQRTSDPFLVNEDFLRIQPQGPTTFCQGSVTLTAVTNASSVTWSNGETTPSITVNRTGVYTVTATSPDGCAMTASQSVTSSDDFRAAAYPAMLQIGPNTYIDTPTYICRGTRMRYTADANGGNPPYTYQWYRGNLQRLDGETGATFETTERGPSFSVVITDSTGCSRSSNFTQPFDYVNSYVDIFPFSSTAICAGGSVRLDGSWSTTTETQHPVSWLWSTGETTHSINVSTPGTYTLTITDNYGCTTTSPPVTVTVNPLPDATVTASGPTTFCEGGAVTLTASSGASYHWSNGATTQSYTFRGSGTYTVTVTNANGCSATSAPVTVTVNPLPAATITASGPTTFCAGGSVTLTASAGSSYAWSNGATTQSITVNASGSYSVTVTNANGCSATSAATTVTVNPLPAPTITASGSTTFCAGGSVTLTASAGTSYSWSNGATTQSITVNASGSYSVTVTNANGCSATSAATTVTVNPLPTPTITASGPTTFCAGGSVTLTASSGTSYSWSNGATTQSITVTQSDDYRVTVTNGNGCSATSAATTVTVNPLPTPTITASGPTTFCAGGSVTLTASAASSYAWSNGATTQSITVTQPDDYRVTVTNSNGCSATSAATTVTVNPLPTATITANGPTTICADGSVRLTASAGSSYLWSNGATTQSITVTQPDDYRVTVTNSNGCSATSAATTVTVNPLPTATITANGPTTICADSPVRLTASAGSSYLWSNGATTQSIDVTQPDDYRVTVTNANGCSATSAVTTVTVNPLPTATITANGPTTFCQGGSVRLTASAGTSYLWSTGATTQFIDVTQGADYTVTVTNDKQCSAKSAPTTVTVNAKPVIANASSSASPICWNGTGYFAQVDSVAGWTYSWSATNATITAGQGTSRVTFNPNPAATSAQLVVTVTNGAGCTDSHAFSFSIDKAPATITAAGPTTFCQGGSVTLSAPAGYTYRWSNNATTQSINVTQTGNYSVTVFTAAGCGTLSAATPVTVNPTTSIAQPANQTTTRNAGQITLSVSATGTNLTYRWLSGQYPNGTQIGTSASVLVGPYTKKGTNYYYVEVTGTCGPLVRSGPVTVTVN